MVNNPFAQFDHESRAYSKANAYALARASELAYEPMDVILKTAPRWGFPAASLIQREDTQVLILECADYAVIAPRGTEIESEGQPQRRGAIRSILFFVLAWIAWLRFRVDLARYDFTDIWTDLDCRKRPGPLGGKVHKGFLGSYELVWERDLQPYLDRMHKLGKPVFLTGHSLGGALTKLIAAGMLENAPQEPAGVYVFGCPRVGDWRFTAAMNAKIGGRLFNHHHNNDIVPRLPLWVMGYRRAGSIVYISSGGAILHDPDSRYVRRDRIAGRMDQPVFDGAKDHRMTGYTAALGAALP